MARVNLDDTSRCPVAERCASCGSPDDLDVGTMDLPVGVCCTTLCGRCVEDHLLPRFPSWTAAVAAVIDHCEHLGVTIDEAAAARREQCPACLSDNTLDLGRGEYECRRCGELFRTPELLGSAS